MASAAQGVVATRRAVGRAAAGLVATGVAGGVAGAALTGCRFDAPALPSVGPRVVRLAVFRSSVSTAIEPGELAALQFATAANAGERGYELRIDQYSYSRLPNPVPADFAPSAEALEQANAGGTPPDVLLLTLAVELPHLLKRRLVAALGEVLKTDRKRLDGYAPGALEAASTRGQLAALPLSGVVTLLFYDEALFRAAAVDPPGPLGAWTWSHFLEACRRLTREAGAAGRPHWGTAAHDQVELLQSLIWAHGGDVLARDGRRAALGEPGARQGIQYWLDLMRLHRVAPLPTEALHLYFGPTELWLTPQRLDGRTTAPGMGAGAPGTPRVAMAVLPATAATPIGRAGTNLGPRTTHVAALPVGTKGTDARRVARFYMVGALALGAKSRDPRTALAAALALADHLHQGPVNYGFPVRNVDAALVRRVQPLVSDLDAEVIASATAHARGVSLEAAHLIGNVLGSRLMAPLLRGQVSLDAAIRDASAALDEGLRT